MKETIAEALHQLIHGHRNQMRSLTTSSGISIPVNHIRSLKCIDKIPNCSARDIAHKLSLDKSQITRVLKDLVLEGYVEKNPDPNNHRSQLLTLTKHGETLLIKLTDLHHQSIEVMTAGLSDQQVADFINISETMISNLRKSIENN